MLSSVTSVFGTQSLLMALGVKQNKLGIAAATTWVLKDALGKCSRMYSASQHGVCQCSALFTHPSHTLTPL